MALQIKKILPFVLLFIFLGAIIAWVIYHFTAEKKLEIVFPKGKEKLQAGKTYQISWKYQNIGKIAIILIKGEDSKNVEWIAKDIPARNRKYNWSVFVWQAPGQDYKISIFEYPWKDGNKIDYSDEITILGPQFASCDQLSIDAEWPFVPSDLPNQRKVFITKKSFNGNLGGLDGADQKCQEEAKEKGWNGNWKAFLGNDQILAVDRLKLDGIFVEANPAATLPEGKTCHRLLGKNFDEFFKKFSDSVFLNKRRLSDDFLKNLSMIWLGRITSESKKECLPISNSLYQDVSKGYSFTTTCQNWTNAQELISSFIPSTENEESLGIPVCYTPAGKRISALAIGGISSDIIGDENNKIFSPNVGKYCTISQKLLCIEQ